MLGWLRGGGPVEYRLPPDEPAPDPAAILRRQMAAALAEIDRLCADPGTSRLTRDALLEVRIKLRPAAPVSPGRSS